MHNRKEQIWVNSLFYRSLNPDINPENRVAIPTKEEMLAYARFYILVSALNSTAKCNHIGETGALFIKYICRIYKYEFPPEFENDMLDTYWDFQKMPDINSNSRLLAYVWTECQGMRKIEAARRFGVTRQTIDNWIKELKEQPDVLVIYRQINEIRAWLNAYDQWVYDLGWCAKYNL